MRCLEFLELVFNVSSYYFTKTVNKNCFIVTDAEFSIFTISVLACAFVGPFGITAQSFHMTAVVVSGTLVYILSK